MSQAGFMPEPVDEEGAAEGHSVEKDVQRGEPLLHRVGDHIEKERQEHHDDDQQPEEQRQRPTRAASGLASLAFESSISFRMEVTTASPGMKPSSIHADPNFVPAYQFRGDVDRAGIEKAPASTPGLSGIQPGRTLSRDRRKSTEAGIVGFAGIAERPHIAAATAADRTIFACAEARFLSAASTTTAALTVGDDAVAGILRFAGIGEGLAIAAAPRADRRIFASAEARFLSTASTAAPALAVADHPVALGLGLAGIGEGLAVAAAPRADGIIFSAAELRTLGWEGTPGAGLSSTTHADRSMTNRTDTAPGRKHDARNFIK